MKLMRIALNLFLAVSVALGPVELAQAAYFGEKAVQLLGGRRQTSLLFDASKPIVRKLGDGESLRFSFGLKTSLWKEEKNQKYWFKAYLKSGFRTHLLHEGVMDPSRKGSHRGWRNVDIDLSKWSGSKVKIFFECGREGRKAEKKPVDGMIWGGLEIGDYRSTPERPNIVLISIDTLRADHLGLYGYKRDTSPFIDEMAKKAVWFRDMIAQSSWTKPSHMSMLTGLLPSSHHIWSAPHTDGDLHELSEKIPTLAEILGRNGYSTQAFTGGGYVSARFGFARGFSRYEEFQGSEHKDAGFVFGNTRRYLNANKDRRFFLFIHTFDGPHKPYRRRFFVNEARAAGKKITQTDWYDGGVRAADTLVRGVFEQLKDQGKLENTVFIITSDHGQELDDRGYDFTDHGATLYDDMIRVPLIIRYDGKIRPREIAGFQAQHIDIAPTILDLARIDPVKEGLPGRSLRSILEGGDAPRESEVFSEFAEFGTYDLFSIRRVDPTSASKFIYCPSVVAKQFPPNANPKRGDRYWYRKLIPEGGIEFYDLKKDPAERKNLAKSSPPRMKPLASKLVEHIKNVANTREPDDGGQITSSPDLDRDLREQLRSLGY